MTDETMDHERLYESAALYALDALEPDARVEFERHLASCASCTEEVRSLRQVAQALPFSVPQIDPPEGLGAKVLAGVGAPQMTTVVPIPVKPVRRSVPATLAWLSAAALFVVSLGLGVYAWTLQQQIGGLQARLSDAIGRLDRSEQQVAVATRAVSTAEGRLAVLLAPDMLQVRLAGQPAAPQATGRAFWSRSRGLVFTAANLPPLPAGRIYQLWMVPNGAPVPAGLFSPDPSGAVAGIVETSPSVAEPVALALTIEPEGGLPAPTGERYLIGLTQ